MTQRSVLRALACFIALAFPLSWYPWLIASIRHSGNPNPNPYGPLLAAIIASAIVGGRPALKTFFRRFGDWRIGARWYAVALLLPVTLVAIAAVLSAGIGASFDATKLVPGELLPRFIFILLFIGLGEEPGWRGYALPLLRERLSPMAASIAIGIPWAIWHLPLFGGELAWSLVPAFLVGLFGACFVSTWMADRTRFSILPQMLMHTMVNTIGAGFLFKAVDAGHVSTLWWSYSLVWLASGAVLIAWPTVAARAASTEVVG